MSDECFFVASICISLHRLLYLQIGLLIFKLFEQKLIDMNTTLKRCCAVATFAFTAFISNSQTSWEIAGNGNITTNNFLGTTNSKPVITRTNNIERMRITPSGNVGIGTGQPKNKLDVNGGIT